MSVASPPRGPEIERDRDLERRVADLEALIEEARRRARRRRQRNWGAALLVAAAGAAAFIGFGGHGGGGGAGSAALAHAPGAQAPAANADSAPLGALPPDAGRAEWFAFDPRNPAIVYVLTVGSSTSTGFERSQVFKTTDGGAHWQATATRGSDWVGWNEALTADPRHPGTLYAGTEVAVFKTVDGGTNWRPSKRGLLTPTRPAYEFNRATGWVLALAVDPAEHEHRLCRLRPRQQEHRRRPQLEDRVPAAPDALPGRERLRACDRPHPPRGDLRDHGRVRQSIGDTRSRTLLDLQVDRRRHDLASNNNRSRQCHRHRTRGRSATSVHRLRGHRCQRPENDQRRARPGGRSHTASRSETPTEVATVSPVGGVRALAIDPRRTGTVYAALTQGGIYKTTNGGHTWIHAFGTVSDMMVRGRGRPRTPGDDLRRRPKRNRGRAPDSQKHRQRPHLGHRALTARDRHHTSP